MVHLLLCQCSDKVRKPRFHTGKERASPRRSAGRHIRATVVRGPERRQVSAEVQFEGCEPRIRYYEPSRGVPARLAWRPGGCGCCSLANCSPVTIAEAFAGSKSRSTSTDVSTMAKCHQHDLRTAKLRRRFLAKSTGTGSSTGEICLPERGTHFNYRASTITPPGFCMLKHGQRCPFSFDAVAV